MHRELWAQHHASLAGHAAPDFSAQVVGEHVDDVQRIGARPQPLSEPAQHRRAVDVAFLITGEPDQDQCIQRNQPDSDRHRDHLAGNGAEHVKQKQRDAQSFEHAITQRHRLDLLVQGRAREQAQQNAPHHRVQPEREKHRGGWRAKAIAIQRKLHGNHRDQGDYPPARRGDQQQEQREDKVELLFQRQAPVHRIRPQQHAILVCQIARECSDCGKAAQVLEPRLECIRLVEEDRERQRYQHP